MAPYRRHHPLCTARASTCAACLCSARQRVCSHRKFCLKDHYAALGVSSAATLAEIKKAFRQQAALHHPDRNAAEGAAARFRAVQEAYDILADDDKRTAYDNNRKRNLLDNPLDTASEIWTAYFNRLI